VDPAIFFLLGFVFWVFISTVLGYNIGERKGRPVNGAILGFLLGWIGVVIIAVMPPTEEVQRKRRQEQADIYLGALEAHGRGSGGSSTSGVQLPTRELIIVEAIKRDPSLAGASDPESLKRLADAITELENEFRTREELRSANELITKQEQEKANQQEADRLRAEASLKAQEEARAKAEVAERAKVARDLRIAAMGPMKRWVVLHKPLAGGILVVVVVALIAGGISINVNLANQEAQRIAAEQAAADKIAADEQAAAEAALKAACLVGTECRVGDTGPGGGIVFYDAGTDQPWGRYLEAAPAGWSGVDDPEEVWCDPDDSDVLGTQETIGSGAANTKLIAAACRSGAANTLSDYDGGGKTDWFLPSKDELNPLYEQRDSVGGFGPGLYWSSSQYGAYDAWRQSFSNGNQYSNGKSLTFGVRPVRAF